MDVQHAVRCDSNQAVVAGASRGVVTLTDTDTGHLGAIALPAASAALFPIEELRTLYKRFFLVSARHRALVATDGGVIARCVDAPDSDLVDTELPRRLAQNGFDGF